MTIRKDRARAFVLCVDNSGYPASLIVRRLYEAIADPDAERQSLLRVVDESGEDYLFPKGLFEVVDLPDAVRQRLAP